jgi:hypothetical protein
MPERKSPPGPKEMAPGVEFGTYYPIAFEQEVAPTEIEDEFSVGSRYTDSEGNEVIIKEVRSVESLTDDAED